MTLRVLVIDDNPQYRVLLRYALGGGGLEIVGEEASAAAGVRAAAELQPDLVLLDVMMEGSDGLLVVQPLREAAPRTAVVAVASHAERELWGAAAHLDGVAYLSKATPPSRLCDELVRIAATRPIDEVLAVERERLPAERQSARAARRFVSGVVTSWGCSDLEDSVLLLASELVTNALIHAHSDVEVVVRLLPDRLRVEVVDAGPEYVHRREATSEEQSGRGMAMTEALASAWGIDTLLTGKSVWFEVLRGSAVPS